MDRSNIIIEINMKPGLILEMSGYSFVIHIFLCIKLMKVNFSITVKLYISLYLKRREIMNIMIV
jgi:hypothetical protein